MRIVGRHISFGDGEAALAGFHLDAVIGDPEPDVSTSEAIALDPAMLVGTYHFVYTDSRRAAVEASLKSEATSPEALNDAIAQAEKEAAADPSAQRHLSVPVRKRRSVHSDRRPDRRGTAGASSGGSHASAPSR